jgi:hypothetical protein
LPLPEKRAPSGVTAPLVTARDPAVILGLLAGSLIALTVPHTRYLALCRSIARMSGGSSATRSRATDIGGVPADQAASIDRDLQAWKLIEGLHIVRGRLFRRPVEVRCIGADNLQSVLDWGRGAVLWVADFALASDVVKAGLHKLGHRHKNVSRPQHGFSESRFGMAFLNPIRTRFEESFGCERLLIDRSAPHVIHAAIVAALAKNEIVAAMATDHEGRRFAATQFFRGWLSLPTGILALAQSTGTPVLPAFVLPRRQGAVFDLRIEHPLAGTGPDAEGNFPLALADFARRLEAHVMQDPGAWKGWRRAMLRP